MKPRVWGDVLFKQFCTGILELCKTILCETVGILARQGKKLSRPEIVEFAQRAKGSFLLSQLYFLYFFCRGFYDIGNLTASRSALPSSSPGRQKNKIHPVLGIKNPKSSKELGLKGIGSSCLMMISLFHAFPSCMASLRGYSY